MVRPSPYDGTQGLNNKLLLDLAYRLGTDNLIEWIEQQTLPLARLGYKAQGFIDFTADLLAAFKVRSIYESSDDLSSLAQLRELPDRDGYEVLYKRLRYQRHVEDVANQRFWIAHELAHIFWLSGKGHSRALSPFQQRWGDDSTIEWLSNRAAAALLLPKALLQKVFEARERSIESWPISLEWLPGLAKHFCLPVRMVARRWLHDVLRWNLAIVCLELSPTRRKDGAAWRVRWEAVPRSGYWRAKTLYRRIIPANFLPDTCREKFPPRMVPTHEVKLAGQWQKFLHQTSETAAAVHISRLPDSPSIDALCAHTQGACYLAIPCDSCPIN